MGVDPAVLSYRLAGVFSFNHLSVILMPFVQFIFSVVLISVVFLVDVIAFL